jgi:hypothetical protein
MKRSIIIIICIFLLSASLWGQNVEYIGGYVGFGYANDLFVAEHYAYVTDSDSCFKILDISNLSSPTVAAKYGSGGYLRVYVSGYYAFLVKTRSVEIIDVSDPTNPALVWSDTTWGLPKAITVRDNYAYITLFYFWDSSDLQIFDVSDPTNPILAGDCDLGSGFAKAISLSGDYAYVASEREGLVIVNISNPYNPLVVGSYWAGHGYYRIYVSADYAYLPSGDIGLEIVDISVPSNPTFVSLYDTDGSATDVGVLDNYAYIADGLRGLLIIDVIDPADPVFAGSFDTERSVNNIFLAGGYIFLMDRNSLSILRFDPPTGTIEEISQIPMQFSLSQNHPNPFNTSTIIRYDLPLAGDVRLEIYDILGRKVETLIDGWQPAGAHSVVWDAEGVSSGIYFYTIRTGEYYRGENCILLK